MVVHGDDFITLGDRGALSEVERAMSDHYTIKVRATRGAGRDDVRWKSDGGKNWMEYEPDPRHAELIVKWLNLESAKGVTDSISQEKAGRCVDDISTVGVIANEKIS